MMALAPGSQLGSFQIGALIGQGGMGEVYRARDTRLGRDVAIKILPRAFTTDPDRSARFEREARALASLNHPNIATIHGIEDVEGTRALVMELLEGETLAERIAKGPIAIAAALPLARQIADALDAAHEKGIVHRDLKPANIKITRDGAVKVLDFGLAKAQSTTAGDDAATMTIGDTREGMIVGTAAYMSPEQARGLAVDKRTDIWAFGCVLYEMLDGRPAFTGKTVSDIIAAILEREPDWSALSVDLPPRVARLLKHCLEKDQRRRLRDIGDAAAEVEDLRSGQPTSATGTSRDRQKARKVWRLAVPSALAIVAAGVGAWQMRREPSPPAFTSANTIVSQLTSYGGTESGGAISPDGRSFAFVSERGGTPDIWLRLISGGEPVRLTNDDAIEARPVFAPNGDSIYYTRSSGNDTSIWSVTALGGQPRKMIDDARAVSVAPDGRRLAWFTNVPGVAFGFALKVGTIDGGEERELVKLIRTVTDVNGASWSPDGQLLAYVSGGLFEPRNLFIVRVSDGAVRRVTHFDQGGAGPTGQAWLPDGRHLVVSYLASVQAQGAPDLGILDSTAGSITRVTTNVADGFYEPSMSADASRLIVSARRAQREVWRVPFGPDPLTNGRQAVRLLDASVDPMWTFATRDGKTLLFNNALAGSRNLWTMPLDQRAEPRQITSIAGNAVMHSSLSPDGALVAFASYTAGTSDIWVQRVDGSNLRQLTNDAAADSWPVWSPDGKTLIFSSLRDGAWITRRLSPDGGTPQDFVSGFFRGDWITRPDGKGTWIVTSTGEGGLRLLDGESGSVLWQENIMPGNALPVFSPDGRSVSISYRETRDRDAIWVYDTATGSKRVVVRFPQQFHVLFRANWVDGGKAFLVNRFENVSNIILFDRFWSGGGVTE